MRSSRQSIEERLELAYMELGLAAALLARIPAERIINFMPLAELTAWIGKVRARAGTKAGRRATKIGA